MTTKTDEAKNPHAGFLQINIDILTAKTGMAAKRESGKRPALAFLAPLVALTFLAACSGSGSIFNDPSLVATGPAPTDPPVTPPDPPPTNNAVIDRSAARAALGAAAGATPVFGSVTQSSDASAMADVTVTFDAAGAIDNTTLTVGSDTLGTAPTRSDTTMLTRGLVDNLQAQQVIRLGSTAENPDMTPISRAVILTGFSGTVGSEEYVSWGYHRFEDYANTTYRYTAFASGNTGYPQMNLMSLTGMATFTGDAVGVYADATDIADFWGDVTLTADFDGTGVGTLGGMVSNIRHGNNVSHPVGSITLGSQTIGNANSGFIGNGVTSAMLGVGDTAVSLAGTWGAQFFGSGSNYPGSVAGTFGASDAAGTLSLLGAFKADTTDTHDPFMTVLTTSVGNNLNLAQAALKRAAQGTPISASVTAGGPNQVSTRGVTQSSEYATGTTTTDMNRRSGVSAVFSGSNPVTKGVTILRVADGPHLTIDPGNSRDITPDLRLPDTTIADYLDRIENRAGIAGTLILTDNVSASINNYISWGYHRFENPAGSPLPVYRYTAFASGNWNYNGDNLAALTGTATYTGEAFGIYANALRRDEFWGDVTLTADFDMEMVSGMVTNLRHGAANVAHPVTGPIMLGAQTIGSANNGFFSGATSVTGDSTLTGMWGAQFYGTGSNTPGSVAGTFGVSNDAGTLSLLGAFKADTTHTQPVPFMSILTATTGTLATIEGRLEIGAQGIRRTGSTASSGGLSASRGTTQASNVGATDTDISDADEYTGISVAFGGGDVPAIQGVAVRVVEAGTYLSSMTGTSDTAYTETSDDNDIRIPDKTLAGRIDRIVNMNGQRGALVLTDVVGSTANNYISWGYWRFENPDTDAYTYTAFVASDWNYDGTNLAALTGTAAYVGRAYGIYANADRRDEFWGDVTLTADFATGTHGSISGMVTNLRHGLDNVAHPITTPIMLNAPTAMEGPITSGNNGAFYGTTSVMGDSTLTGTWGGQFFGTGNGIPAAVGGTFGISDGSTSLLGSFKAGSISLTFTSANADNHATITDLRGRISGSTALRTGSVVTPTTREAGPGSTGVITVAGQALTFRANSAVTNLSLIQTRVGS
ncbi:MAG: hypothetical protein V6Z81_10605, partial [Parvularculales bacterium]